MSLLALNVASARGTAKNPKIVEATGKFWKARVRQSNELYEHYAARGTPKHPGVFGLLGSTIPRILRIGAPEHLSSVLDYFNSHEDDRNGLILEYGPPVDIAEAFRNFGDESHVEAAKKFAQKLRDVGKDDIADDIDRSIKRISQKAGQRRDPSAGVEDGGKEAGTADAESGASFGKRAIWPWVAAVGVLLAALVTYFRMKRSQA